MSRDKTKAGYLENVEEIVKELSKTYADYIREVITSKVVDDLSDNDLSFMRLVSSSSICNMRKPDSNGKKRTKLEILKSYMDSL